jgi:hypothetical protein
VLAQPQVEIEIVAPTACIVTLRGEHLMRTLRNDDGEIIYGRQRRRPPAGPRS